MTSGMALTGEIARLAENNLGLWDVPHDASLHLLNVSENTTFLVKGGSNFNAVLRVHRTGYHSQHAVECELDWIIALRHTGVIPSHMPIPGRNGHFVQTAESDALEGARMMVLFEHIDGIAPSQSRNLEVSFRALGKVAAHCHNHALKWKRPKGFERLTWDTKTILGPNAIWGDWRDAPNVDGDITSVLEKVETVVTQRLKAYGKADDRFNLIHADMRLANILISPDALNLIDFDDCGFGWLMYDFAAACSFIEDAPNLPVLKAAWLEGYQKHRKLSAQDIAEIETLVMLRRMALLAWIGSHIEAPEPQALAPDFARVTAKLGQAYLDNQ